MPQVVSVTAAAEALSLTRTTVLRLIKAGQLPATRIGHQYRIRVSDLNAIMRPVPPKTPTGDAA